MDQESAINVYTKTKIFIGMTILSFIMCVFRKHSPYKSLQNIQKLYKFIFLIIKQNTVIYTKQCYSHGDKMSRHQSHMQSEVENETNKYPTDKSKSKNAFILIKRNMISRRQTQRHSCVEVCLPSTLTQSYK